MYTSEIEKLEKRWADNPKGRNFAPLADAYRKAGELDRAIELCKAGLARHPDYVSAHIVYGRCLIEQKNDASAADVFRKVLTLDPENVLGLKILAEIAERSGRYDEAVEWLSRLLSADPMNGEAAEALARAKGKAAQGAPAAPAATVRPVEPPAPAPAAPVASAPASSPGPAPQAGAARTMPPRAPTPAAPAGPPARPPAPDRAAPSLPARAAVPRGLPEPPAVPDFVVQSEEPPPSPELKVTGRPRDIESYDGTIDFNARAPSAARADGIEVQEEVQLKPEELPVEGLAHTQYESGFFGRPPEPPAAEEPYPAIDLPLIMPDGVAAQGPSTPTPPAPPAPAGPPPAPAPPGRARAAERVPPAAVGLSDDDGAADTAALSRAEPVLTETMAELYLKQGHLDEALRVYQALLTERPGDPRLRARVAALTPGGRPGRLATGESLPQFLRRIMAGRLGAAAPAPPLTPAPSPRPPLRGASQEAAPEGRVPPSGGAQLLDTAFGIASVPPEPRPEVNAPGEATRLATDSISLDRVFGEDSLGSSGPRPVPPAPPPPSPAAPEPTKTGGFSFDQFFSPSVARGGAPDSAAPGGTELSGPSAPKVPGRAAGPKPPPQAEDEGDLDQFQAWLRGLKS